MCDECRYYIDGICGNILTPMYGEEVNMQECADFENAVDDVFWN